MQKKITFKEYTELTVVTLQTLKGKKISKIETILVTGQLQFYLIHIKCGTLSYYLQIDKMPIMGEPVLPVLKFTFNNEPDEKEKKKQKEKLKKQQTKFL